MKRDHGGRARQYICCGIEAQDYFGAILAHSYICNVHSVSQEKGRGGGVLVKRREGEEVC